MAPKGRGDGPKTASVRVFAVSGENTKEGRVKGEGCEVLGALEFGEGRIDVEVRCSAKSVKLVGWSVVGEAVEADINDFALVIRFWRHQS